MALLILYCNTTNYTDTCYSAGIKWKANSHTGMRISEKDREDTSDKLEREEWEIVWSIHHALRNSGGSCVSLNGALNEWRIWSRGRAVWGANREWGMRGREGVRRGWWGDISSREREEETEWVMRRWRQRREERVAERQEGWEVRKIDETQWQRDKSRERTMRECGEDDERRGWENTQIISWIIYIKSSHLIAVFVPMFHFIPTRSVWFL